MLGWRDGGRGDICWKGEMEVEDIYYQKKITDGHKMLRRRDGGEVQRGIHLSALVF